MRALHNAQGFVLREKVVFLEVILPALSRFRFRAGDAQVGPVAAGAFARDDCVPQPTGGASNVLLERWHNIIIL